jgi:hypothetical protein
MLSAIHVVAKSMLKSVRTGRNRRYPDFLNQRRNQCWTAISIVVIVVLATLGFAHLINNGVKNKTTYSGYVTLTRFRTAVIFHVQSIWVHIRILRMRFIAFIVYFFLLVWFPAVYFKLNFVDLFPEICCFGFSQNQKRIRSSYITSIA